MDSIPSPSPSSLETISANLRTILLGLMGALGKFGLEPAIGIMMHRRVSSVIRRMERLLTRYRTGSLWLRPHRLVVRGRKKPVPAQDIRLPRTFGWLMKLGTHHAGAYHSLLQTVLGTPEMAALLAESAQARRILRPLCRALAMEVPGVSGAATTTSRETKPRVRKPRVKPEPFRIPLPRGVLAWARREGFGKLR